MTSPNSHGVPLAAHEHNTPSDSNSNNTPSCCPAGDGVLGYTPLNPDEPLLGTRLVIPTADIPLYVTGAPLDSCTRIIVVFTDVFGMDSGHHQHVADRLAHHPLFASAKERVCVVLPDLFRGSPILQPWTQGPAASPQDLLGMSLGAPGMVYRIKRYYSPDAVETMVYDMVVPWLEAQTETNPRSGTKIPVSCVGFCFGGWVVGLVLGHSQVNNHHRLQFDCGVGIHPSFQPQLLHGGTREQVALRLRKPMLLLPSGQHDLDMCPGSPVVTAMRTVYQHKLKLAADRGFTRDEQVSVVFPTMPHGWVTRGDTSDPHTAEEQARALQLAVEFIQQWSN